jgi:hypothetical protein
MVLPQFKWQSESGSQQRMKNPRPIIVAEYWNKGKPKAVAFHPNGENYDFAVDNTTEFMEQLKGKEIAQISFINSEVSSEFMEDMDTDEQISINLEWVCDLEAQPDLSIDETIMVYIMDPGIYEKLLFSIPEHHKEALKQKALN